jgi:SAM-dependent methyltransferase
MKIARIGDDYGTNQQRSSATVGLGHMDKICFLRVVSAFQSKFLRLEKTGLPIVYHALWDMTAYLRSAFARIFRGEPEQLKSLAPYRSLPTLNELTNPNKWSNPEWLKIHLDLEGYSVDKHCFSSEQDLAYRKGWEWTQAIYGLSLLGAIRPDAKGLGVGAGHEPLLFYFADRIAEVVGTDLYGNAQWSAGGGKEADAGILEDAAKFCPRAFNRSRLRLRVMDGTDLKFDDDTFDFVWSLSSIEHFGSHKAARKSVSEMGRVTKPGGVVVVATEFIIGPKGKDHPEYFTRKNFDEFVLNASPNLLPIQPMNYSLPPAECLDHPINVGTKDVHRIRHHIVLDDGNVQWTSAMVFFEKINRKV